jgi:hypothetical protein
VTVESLLLPYDQALSGGSMKTNKIHIAMSVLMISAGCATQKTFVTTTAEPRHKVFDNVQSFIAQKNYNVLDANKEAGFIRAEKPTSNPALAVLSGVHTYDQLQVTIFQQANGTGLRIQATSFQEVTNQLGIKRREVVAPSEKVTRDAREILQHFGGTIAEVADES